MTYTDQNNRIKFCGDSIEVNGTRYKISAKSTFRFRCCTNQKEYVESIEHFAYLVLVKKDIPNDGWFEK